VFRSPPQSGGEFNAEARSGHFEEVQAWLSRRWFKEGSGFSVDEKHAAL
jgi:hypothetical protein